ncbi:hypothetical protein FGO68_gene8899 [Halteria grandinella]|uniref:Uncharacterized protein n=1 Tax=Halteria grandinella TaxID=5974 RepID=A0A8J8NWX7_HALGN|nr:hypothetical protein FGO68_gene8899 [Halteria grandinella]
MGTKHEAAYPDIGHHVHSKQQPQIVLDLVLSVFFPPIDPLRIILHNRVAPANSCTPVIREHSQRECEILIVKHYKEHASVEACAET